MAFFLSTFTNKIDKKGRVSVPASFRDELVSSNFRGIIVYKPFEQPCIEGADIGFLEQLSDQIYGDFNPFDTQQASLATAILAGSARLPFDPEGRVSLPSQFLEQAGISDHATFVGLGRKFQIWSPEQFESYSKAAREDAPRAAQNLTPFGGGRS